MVGLLRPAWLTLWAAILAWFFTAMAAQLNNVYYQYHPFLGDTASFYSSQLELWQAAQSAPKRTVIWDRFFAEWKNPGLYLSYLFLPSSQLASANGHLLFTGFALWSFLATFGIAVLKRVGSVTYATVAPLVLFSFAGLFDPLYQIPSKLADPPAAFFFGATLMAIFASEGAKRLPWLLLVGTLIALTLLSRFTAAGYVFVAAAPLLAFYWIQLLSRRQFRTVLMGIACVVAPIVVLAGYHLVTYLALVLEFYRTAGYGLNQGVVAAIATTGEKFFALYFQPWGIAVPGLMAAFYIAQYWRLARWQDVFLTFWPVIAHPVLILLVLTVKDDAPQLTYVIGPYMLLAVAPFGLRRERETHNTEVNPRTYALACAPFLVTLALSVPQVTAVRTYVYHISPQHITYALLSRSLANVSADYSRRLKRPVTIDAAFDYYWRYVQPTARHAYGAVLLTTRRFDVRQEQWRSRKGMGASTDPGYADRAIPEMMDYYREYTDLLFLLTDPDAPEAFEAMKDPFTIDMAKRLRAALQADPSWNMTKSGIVGPYGEVEVWRNVRRTQ